MKTNQEKYLPYGRQTITEADIEAVTNILRGDFITQGPTVPEFEKKTASKIDARYCVAVNSATSALHIACLALGLEQGDYLWTSPITFIASAMSFNGLILLKRTSLSEASGGVVSAVNTKLPECIFL